MLRIFCADFRIHRCTIISQGVNQLVQRGLFNSQDRVRDTARARTFKGLSRELGPQAYGSVPVRRGVWDIP